MNGIMLGFYNGIIKLSKGGAKPIRQNPMHGELTLGVTDIKGPETYIPGLTPLSTDMGLGETNRRKK